MEKFGSHGRRESNWLTLIFASICTLAVVGSFDPVLAAATDAAFIVLISAGVLIVIISWIKDAMAMHHVMHAPLEVLLREVEEEDEEARKNEQP